MARCASITSKGTRCKGIAIDGYDYCYAHSPDRAEERRRWASKGGRRGGRGRGSSGELAELKDQLQDLTDRVLAGKLDQKAAAVCGQLLNVKLRVLEQERRWKETEEHEERLEALESVLMGREKAQ
jgi:Skp family chaperone for outer membrane proteins